MKYTTQSTHLNRKAFRVTRKFAWLPVLIHVKVVNRKYDDPISQNTFIWLSHYYNVEGNAVGLTLEDAINNFFKYELSMVDRWGDSGNCYNLQTMIRDFNKYIANLVCTPKTDGDDILRILNHYKDVAETKLNAIEKSDNSTVV